VVGTQKEDILFSQFLRLTRRQKSTGQELQKRSQRTTISRLIGPNGLTKKMKERPEKRELKRNRIGTHQV